MVDWNPSRYLAFVDERTRAARDLLTQVPLECPQVIYDLGCGPGNSTGLLATRYPEASIVGIDNSPAMLVKAREACPSVRFEVGDLASWAPDREADLLFSNAALQWLPDPLAVMERLAATLSAGGVLAVQMPDNLEEPSHVLMRETAAAGPWAARLASATDVRKPIPSPRDCYTRLKPVLASLDIRHIVYHHVLDGQAAIADWFASTGLRPFLEPLGADEREAFVTDYTARLARAYPSCADGRVLFRFPRLFIVGRR